MFSLRYYLHQQNIYQLLFRADEYKIPAQQKALSVMRHYMRHNLLLLLISLILASCDNNSTKEPAGNIDTVRQTTTTALTSSNDTLFINTMTAVFTDPDSLQIEKRKKEAGEENFYAGADDYMYYLNLAHEFLDSVKLKTVVATNKKFILFVSNDKSQHLIRTDTLAELWNIYFFDPTKKAKSIDMTAIDEEYKSYFK